MLLLLGVVSVAKPAALDAGCVGNVYEKYWKLNGGMEAISNRARCCRIVCWRSARSMAGNWRV
ncbi:hypothetical protein KCP74_14420 [Salmonella enterica subsp. enterica]|nr:hypothetical protein KCP74_14420 [Salmonella enterica subsp. enterica]